MNEKKVIWPGSTQLAPVPAVLVGCGGEKGYKNNLITIAWAGVVCSQPAMVSISIRPERYSYEIIGETGCFTVNLPTEAQAAAVDWCGVLSGRKVDKFKEQKFTPIPGSRIVAPLVAECPVGLECKVTRRIALGSHELFLAEIVAVQVSESYLDQDGKLDLTRDGLLVYAHGGYYHLGAFIGKFGFSVRSPKSSAK